MNPEDKAQQLINKYNVHCYVSPTNNNTTIYHRKNCAFIYVEGMIEEHTFKNPMKWNLTRLRYWQQVKKEIEEL